MVENPPPLRIPEHIDSADEFEDLVAALFVAGGWHVTQNVHHHEDGQQLLEMDLLAVRWRNGGPERLLVEAKSGNNWGHPDLLKLFGQQQLLGLPRSRLAVRSANGKSSPASLVAKGCEIMELDGDAERSRALFATAGLGKKPTKADVAFWRRVFQIRRRLLEGLRDRGSAPQVSEVLRIMKEQKRLIDDGLLQHATAYQRLGALCDGYRGHQKLAARMAHALDDSSSRATDHMRSAFYGVGHKLVYLAMFLDMRARMATLAAVVDFLLAEDDARSASQRITLALGLPSSMSNAIEEFRTQEELHLYPLIWQRFVYEMGGFLLLDRLDGELDLLADATGAKPNTVRQALEAWNMLFPVPGGWLRSIGAPHLQVLMLVPAPIQGLGALRRQRLYDCQHHDGRTYFSSIVEPSCAHFLKRVNNITYYRCLGQDCPPEEIGPAAAL